MGKATAQVIQASALRLSMIAFASPSFPEPRKWAPYAPTPAQMTAVAKWCGLDCVAVAAPGEAGQTEGGGGAFAARLVGDAVFYNALADPRRQAVYIWHEIVEHLARRDIATLFDDDPTVAAARYDGAVWPTDVRHLVARASEALLIRAFPELAPRVASQNQSALQASIDAWFASQAAAPAPICRVHLAGVDGPDTDDIGLDDGEGFTRPC